VPIIVLTAKELSRDEERALASRVSRVIAKGSYRGRELEDEVRRVMQGAEGVSPAAAAGVPA
jgi:hypothetical protein